MLYDFQSRNWRQLAQGSFGNPEWVGDDTFLSVVDVQSMSIVRIRVSNGATEPLANLQNERAALTAVGFGRDSLPTARSSRSAISAHRNSTPSN